MIKRSVFSKSLKFIIPNQMTQSKASYFILPTEDRDLERSSLSNGKPAKTTKKSNYGSLQTDAAKTQQTANAFIVNYKHTLMPGDTLLNISLKYNVPIENIKRANRLWNNDLTKLFKDSLIIPLDKEKMKTMNLTMSGDQETNQIHKSESTIEMEKAEYKDFLNKFDSFINESKVKLATLESQNSNQAVITYLNNIERYNQNSDSNSNSFFREDDLFSRNDALFKQDANKNKQQMESSSSSSTSSSNLSNVLQRSSNSNLTSNGQRSETPEHVTSNPNKFSNYFGSNHNLISSTDGSSDRARKAKENLERLEREKDDLYEL